MSGKIAASAKIAPTARVADTAIIGENAVIGANAELRDNVVVYPGTVLGAGVTVFENSVLGRPPKKAGALARPVPTSLEPLRIGEGTVVGASCVLYAGTDIGRDALIADLVSIREGCKIGNSVLLARCCTVNYEAVIGDHTRIMDLTHITGCMLIEDHVFIGPGVMTTNDNSMGRKGHASLNQINGPIVRRGAAIGANCTLLPGVEIGELAIVGVGAVVTRNVPPRVVVMGVPARVVKDVPEDLLELG